MNVLLVLEKLVGRRVLVAALDHRLPDGQCLLLVGHARLDPRFSPSLKAGDILDLVGDNLDVAHDAHRALAAAGPGGDTSS
jgi:hypothetical protein